MTDRPRQAGATEGRGVGFSLLARFHSSEPAAGPTTAPCRCTVARENQVQAYSHHLDLLGEECGEQGHDGNSEKLLRDLHHISQEFQSEN